ncbi:MAG: ABC transporter ATP-binding protein [Anaerolineales bacterium]|nr:ABC transporter ATP-binding protein [Anaerolineales bacterium]MCS7247453.1 ABC transporter ATP-binding protein [Anaerolineales bacterium]MDW8161264.1 ABC transporter ATP-binding protein [Anaerolineales bacterium]MDW8447097.1 ABC transporter ATP-binding protein [Anaerolineales bacterium]
MFATKGLSKSFGRLTALLNVSFEVEEGEIFGIAGPNGAGKSTLFNVITGIYPPSSGRIFFRGKDITNYKPDQICHLGIARTFQIPTTFHTLSVYDNLRVGAIFGARRPQSADEVLELLGLEAVRHRPARNLDLYTTKLVMLGAALATDCKLLMLDEPMAGLSMAEINQFLEIVRRINQEKGVTIIIIEHLLDILISLTKRMLILSDGQVLYLGDSKEVTADRRVVEVYLGGKGGIAHAHR